MACPIAAKTCMCGVCEKIFSEKSDLKRHILVHTGDRPFKCKTL